MVTAKCNKCGGSAEGKTMQEARDRLNHAVGKSRGIKCGDNYGYVVEIKDKTKKHVEKKVSTEEKPKVDTVEKPTTSKPESSKSTSKKSKYF